MKRDNIVLVVMVVLLGIAGYFLGNQLFGTKKYETDLELSSYSVDLFVGDKYTITYKVLPENTKYKKVTWYSQNEKIVTVSNGELIGVSEGSTKILVSTENNKVTKEIKVKVSKKPVEANIIINNKEIELHVGNSKKIDYSIQPSNADNKTVSWNTSNSKVATVDNNGLVLAKGVGIATITGKLSNGKSATCKVSVIDNSISKIKINSLKIKINNQDVTNENISIKTGNKLHLTVEISPSNATNKIILWTSSNTKLAEIDKNGVLTSKKEGKVVITARTNDLSNIQVSVNITIKNPDIDTKVDISKTNVNSIAEQKYTGKEINPKVIVNYNGNVLKEGTDYTLSYKNNINVGTASVIITGKGNYTGTKIVNFTIKKEGSSNSKHKVTFILPVSEMNFTLKNKIKGDGKTISPTNKSSDGKTITYTLADGGYQYTISGNNYYKYAKSIVVSGKDLTIDANPGQKGSKGWEATPSEGIVAYSDNVVNALKISDSLKKEYSFVFTTPSFKDSKKNHEFTTYDEMKSFIASLNDSNDNLYSYYIDQLPVVIFTKTNLNSYSKVNDALKAVKKNNKLNIFYTAEVHGNEPASGEGALAMIKSLDGTYGNSILDKVNIIIMPLVNPSGAKKYGRTNANNVDMNRDYIYSSTKEIQIVHSVYNIILPEITIDAHENDITSKSREKYIDMQLGLAYNLNRPNETNELATKVLTNLISNIKKKGLYPGIYLSNANAVRPTTARVYNGLYGSISLLIESSGGVKFGKELWERRVLSQYVTAEQYINYAVNNASDIKTIIANSRNEIVSQGTKFNSNNKIVINHDTSEKREKPFKIEVRSFNLLTGEYRILNENYGWIDKIGESRPRPSAYVISKEAKNADTVVKKLKYSGIDCYTTPNNTNLMLLQYSGSKTSASYSNEKKVNFANGAYVCTMNQYGANILALAMEPDNKDNDKASFVQRGLISVSDIYRSHRDLVNSNDKDAINKMKLPIVK